MEKQYELGDTVYAVKRFEFLQSDFPNIMTGAVTGKRIYKGKIEYNCDIHDCCITTDKFLLEELHDSREDAIIAIENEYKKWVIATQEKIDKKKQELGIK